MRNQGAIEAEQVKFMDISPFFSALSLSLHCHDAGEPHPHPLLRHFLQATVHENEWEQLQSAKMAGEDEDGPEGADPQALLSTTAPLFSARFRGIQDSVGTS